MKIVQIVIKHGSVPVKTINTATATGKDFAQLIQDIDELCIAYSLKPRPINDNRNSCQKSGEDS